MSPAELLQELHAAGAVITVDGDRLRVGGPARVVTDQMLAELRAHKAKLISLLSAPPACLRCGEPRHRPTLFCAGCLRVLTPVGPDRCIQCGGPLTGDDPIHCSQGCRDTAFRRRCVHCDGYLAENNALYCTVHRDRILSRFPDLRQVMARVSEHLAVQAGGRP